MEKRLLFAALLSLGVLVLWSWLGPQPVRRPTLPIPVPTPGALVAPTAVAVAAVPAPGAVRIAGTEEGLTTIENDVARATFSNRGAVLTSLVLRKHFDDQKRPLELVRALPDASTKPLAVLFPGNAELTKLASSALYAVEKGPGRTLRFQYGDERLSVTKEIRPGDGYLFEVKVSVAGPEFTLLVGTGLRNPTPGEHASRYVMPAEAVAAADNGLQRISPRKLTAEQRLALPPGGFVGIEDNYFLAAIAPRQAAAARVYPVAPPAASADPAAKPDPLVAAGVTTTGTLDARVFFGPKDVEILERTGLGLEKTVNFGWFGILARPLLWLLKRAYAWTGNFGVAILSVTLLIRILLFPLMHKSYASMKKMQKLAPKMNAIRDRYKKAKTDAAQRAKMNQELMALYQAEGYNPMSGCFPVILQLPILVAFYNVLSKAVELRHAPFVLWIHDLSAVDKSYLLLILMIVTMYIQQAMTPSTVDPMQKRIFMAMPLLWGFMLKDMPSGLVLYWLFSNVLTILQQMLINRMGKDEPGPGKPARVKVARA